MTNPIAVEIDRKLLTFWIGEAAEVDARELLHKAATEIRRLQRLLGADEPSSLPDEWCMGCGIDGDECAIEDGSEPFGGGKCRAGFEPAVKSPAVRSE